LVPLQPSKVEVIEPEASAVPVRPESGSTGSDPVRRLTGHRVTDPAFGLRATRAEKGRNALHTIRFARVTGATWWRERRTAAKTPSRKH
jgi:hypothetical protein